MRFVQTLPEGIADPALQGLDHREGWLASFESCRPS
jgi:hypothetical protein